jgi:prepilin-type N-terminal cleavage/methylation domain-containing protein
MSMPRFKMQRGLTLLEILAAMVVISGAVAIFLKTAKPTITSNASNKKYIDVTGSLTEILDSAMTQPAVTLDLMNGNTYTSRQGVGVKLTVTSFSQGTADAIISGLDITKMRHVQVTAVTDTTRYLTATVSNYEQSTTTTCYSQ